MADDDPTGHHELVPGEPRSFGNGRFVVRRRLGAGNFATVYLAHDERLDVAVAVKLLSDRWSWEPEVRGRFVQEARLLRSLNDHRVVQIRDIAETDDGRPYLVMDLATRGTLEQRLVELTQRGIVPTTDELRQVAAAIADALGFLHARRIAHRDIKPSNLLLTTDGAAHPGGNEPGADDTGLLRSGERIMLGDLGLAKDLRLDSGVTVGVGTAGYMAPEQALAGAKIDTRTDVYAASALLAQIASGEVPDPLRRYSNGAIVSGRPLPPSLDGRLRGALAHGLETDADLRPQTIEAWHAEVDGALVAIQATALLPPPAPPPSRRRVAVGGAALVLAVGLVGLVMTLGDDPASRGDSGASTTIASTIPTTTTPMVTLVGPTEITRGVQASWTVEWASVVSGTWSLTGPVQPGPGGEVWAPGDFFQGTWNAPGTFTLALTAVDTTGAEVRDEITFTVT